MRAALVTSALFAAMLTLAACKFESSTWFDNNCTGNAVVKNPDHCATYGKE